jgi:hypothetical protein
VHQSHKLALFVIEITKDLNCKIQRVVIEKVIFHPLIKNMILNYLSNLSIMMQNQKMISSLKTNITDHLISQKPSQIVVAKNIVYMLISSQLGAIITKGVHVCQVISLDFE